MIVQAKNLTVRHGNTLAPDGVDLVSTPGSVLGVVGRNGSGKPTLVKALAGLAVGPSCEAVPALDPAGPRHSVAYRADWRSSWGRFTPSARMRATVSGLAAVAA